MSLTRRVDVAADQLERLRNPMGLAETTGKSLAVASKILARIERDIPALSEAIAEVNHTPLPFLQLNMRERLLSAIQGFSAWAKTVGAAVVPDDSALSMMVLHAPDAHREYWAAQSRALMRGLVKSEKDMIGALLREHGVLLWVGEFDELIRIINTRWLEAHADIWPHVRGEWVGGRRCRFCRAEEPSGSQELQHVEPERRNGYTAINGQVQFDPGSVLVHSRCEKYWRQWVTIAGKYPTLEDARASDQAAGRESREPPHMPGLEPDKPAALPAGYLANPNHYNAQEQGR